MNESKFALKDLVSIGGLLIAVLSGAMWVGSIAQRVEGLEGRADLSDDVSSLKTQLILLDRQLDRMEQKIDRLPRSPNNQ